MPQENNLDPDLSVQENLSIYGRYYGLDKQTINERVPELLNFMALEAKTDAKVMHLSGGMKRRLIMARALIGDPDLIILDEPTTGLDPQARVMIWRQLQALKSAGKTLLLTTHYMDEAERLCDDIFMIDNGVVLDRDTPRGLIDRHVKKHVLEVEKPVPDMLPIMEMENLGQTVLFFLDDLEADFGEDACWYRIYAPPGQSRRCFSAADRPPIAGKLRIMGELINRFTNAVWFRNLLTWRRLFWPSMATNVANPLIFLFAFGFGLGAVIETIDGISYLAFVVPGMMAYSAMFAASFEASVSAYARFSMQRTWDAILSSPVRLVELLTGELLWCASKAMLAALTVLVVGGIWGGGELVYRCHIGHPVDVHCRTLFWRLWAIGDGLCL